MSFQGFHRVEVLLNRGEADVWYPGTVEGEAVRLDDYPYGPPLVRIEDIAVLRPAGDAEAHFRWWHTNPRTGKRGRTPHKMKPCTDMAGQDDTMAGPFIPDLSSREVRLGKGEPAGYLGTRSERKM